MGRLLACMAGVVASGGDRVKVAKALLIGVIVGVSWKLGDTGFAVGAATFFILLEINIVGYEIRTK